MVKYICQNGVKRGAEAADEISELNVLIRYEWPNRCPENTIMYVILVIMLHLIMWIQQKYGVVNNDRNRPTLVVRHYELCQILVSRIIFEQHLDNLLQVCIMNYSRFTSQNKISILYHLENSDP